MNTAIIDLASFEAIERVAVDCETLVRGRLVVEFALVLET